KKNKIKKKCKEGAKLKSGDTIATLEDYHDFILTRERVLLNIIQRLSGISSLTDSYVKKLNSKEIKILDTRKTTPGIRLFEKYAVNAGGGTNHRFNLAEGVMIKDNHIGTNTTLKEALDKIRHTDKPIQVEVDTKDQLCECLKYNVRAVLLDNMDPSEIKECIQIIRGSEKEVFIEVSGGITLKTINKYLINGVDAISVGAIIHQATFKNIKLEHF
ncbi:MAG TPA: carboxylating nicotinate-nucleotide diphosphorylase, partial [Maribacter sp.]|nr:carboxylating nicotinate-nucleotide diphosphorylase [Maribacter sp.]